MKTVTVTRADVRHLGKWLKDGDTLQVSDETARAWERRGWAKIVPDDPKDKKKG